MTEKNPLCFYSPVALTTNMVYEHCHTEICGFFVQIFHLATEGHQAEAYGQPFFSFESGHWHQQNKEHCKWMDCKRKNFAHVYLCEGVRGKISQSAGEPCVKGHAFDVDIGWSQKKIGNNCPDRASRNLLAAPCKGLMERFPGLVMWFGTSPWRPRHPCRALALRRETSVRGSPRPPNRNPTGDFEFNSIIPNRVLQSPLGLGQWQPWPEFSPAFSTVRLPQLVVSIGQLSPQTSPCPPPPSNTPPSKLEEP